MAFPAPRRARAFSLIELVIVVVIIGIIAAIAIPRMSRGAAGANDSALTGNLAVLRKAIDLYAAEHGGTFPPDEARLTGKTDINGTVGTTTGTHIYGPYLRDIPKLNVGANKGFNGFTDTLGTASKGWVYNAVDGTIRANCTDAETDTAGTKYNAY